MTISKKEFEALQAKVDRAQSERDKATGQLEAVQDRIKTEFGCNTLKDAKAKLKSLEMEAGKAETAFEEAYDNFEEEWGEYAEQA